MCKKLFISPSKLQSNFRHQNCNEGHKVLAKLFSTRTSFPFFEVIKESLGRPEKGTPDNETDWRKVASLSFLFCSFDPTSLWCFHDFSGQPYGHMYEE